MSQTVLKNGAASPKTAPADNFSAGYYSVTEKQSGLMLAVNDLIAGLLRARLWLMLALFDMRARYHRTFLGPMWVLLSFTIFLLVKVFIFTGMSGTDANHFIVHLTMGLCVWFYLAAAIGDGAGALVKNRSWILGVKTPYSLFIYSGLALAFFNFVICLIPSYAVVAFYQSIGLQRIALSLVGVGVLTYCLFWISFLLALVSVFVRDLMPLVSTVMRIMFFLTPIVWLPSTIGADKAAFIAWNPFYHMIEIIRAPIVSGQIPEVHLYVVLGLTVALQAASVILFGFLRRWVPSYL